MADGSLIFNTDLDTSGLSSGLGKVGDIAGTAFKGVAVAAGAAATAVGFVAKGALDGYAAYEQLTGGVETLFKDSSDTVMKYAEKAYQTTGLSANEYMETATSFSASLIQSLDGDTAKAAEVANMAITDMSDNANKMGTDITMIQNAYNGFAKGNYTMLDNLKLGYGGTKEEMERLLEDAKKISGIEYDISSFADVADAIHVIQTNLEISGISYEEAMARVASGEMTMEEAMAAMGTTAKEASATIEGSTAAMKASWENLLVGIADDEADLGALVDQFVNSLATAGENILPRIEIILNGIGQLVQTMLPVVIEMALTIITDTLPQLLSAGVSMVESLVTGISENLGAVMDMALTVIMQLVDVLLQNLPMVIETGLQIIAQLAFGIAEALPELIPTLVDTVLTIVDTLIENIDLLIDAAIAIIMGLADGLIEALPRLIDKIPTIIEKLVDAIVNNLPKLVEAGIELTLKLAVGLVKAIPQLVSKIPQIISALWDGLMRLIGKFTDIGKNIVEGIWQGISNGFTWIKNKIVGWVGDVLGFFKKMLGIASPSKEFKWVGEMCVAGFDEGIEELMDGTAITRSINASVNTLGANTSSSNNSRIGGFNQTINVNREISTPDELARAVRLESRYGLMKGVALA